MRFPELFQNLLTLGVATVFSSFPPGPALGHTIGEGDSDLTPPMIAYAEDLEILKKDFGSNARPLRGVFQLTDLWTAGSTLKACFYDGEPKLKAFFVQTAQKWLPGTSLRVDFGASPDFRLCRSDSTDDIRITFEQMGHWSYVGAASVNPGVLKNGASLSVETRGRAFEELNLVDIERVTLHEFGHALGLLHEHQSPTAKCGDEFDWPKIFSYAEKNWGWDEDKVKQNFGPYVSDPRLRTTAYDRTSIMHYALADWMFTKGKRSRCFIAQPKAISKLDRATILSAYPPVAVQQDRELQRRASQMSGYFREFNLDAVQLGKAGVRISYSMKHFDRKLKLQFAVSGDGVVRRSPTGTLNPCQGDDLKIAGAPSLSCGVAPDGSGFEIELNP